MLSSHHHLNGTWRLYFLWPPCVADADIIFLPCGFYLSFFFIFLTKSQRSQTGCLPYFHTRCGLSANLECTSETSCIRLAENTGRKNRHLSTIAQLCWAISSQLRHVSRTEKKLLNSNTFSTSSDNMVNFGLRPTNGWDLLATLGHPCKFQRGSRLGSVTAQHSSSGRQPNFAALNRRRHLYSAGRPSRWELAHILVISAFHFQLLRLFVRNTKLVRSEIITYWR